MGSNEPRVVCGACGYVNAPGSRACVRCGVSFGGYSTLNPESTGNAPANLTCPSCGGAVNPTWKFCESCAYNLRDSTEIGTYRRCPNCGQSYQRGVSYCEHCGTQFSGDENQSAFPNSPAPVGALGIQPMLPGAPPPLGAPKASIRCPRCGATVAGGQKHCGDCGASTVRRPGKRGLSGPQIGLIVGIAIILGTGIGYFAHAHFKSPISPDSPRPAPSPSPSGSEQLVPIPLEQRLEDAISAGHLFEPKTDNAYDLYHEFTARGSTPQSTAPFEARLLWMLDKGVREADAGLQAFYTPPQNRDPGMDRWQEYAKLLNWAAEMKPDDSKLAAKAAFCGGRAAYNLGHYDESLNLWKSASNKDSSWALPANEIGIVYRDHKRNLSEALKYFDQACKRDEHWALPYFNIGACRLREAKEAFANGHYETAKVEYAHARESYQAAGERARQWAPPRQGLRDVAEGLGDVALATNDPSTAEVEFQTALKLTHDRGSDYDRIKRKLKLAQVNQGDGA
jgi:hypothetical protein